MRAPRTPECSEWGIKIDGAAHVAGVGVRTPRRALGTRLRNLNCTKNIFFIIKYFKNIEKLKN